MNIAIRELRRIERENRRMEEMERMAAPLMLSVLSGLILLMYWVLP